MLKIRLMRIGTKKRPFYRVVVVDERSKRTGGYIELLGTFNPLTEPKDIKLKQDRIDHWIKQGAQPSDGYLRMTGKAPKRPSRKPKKTRGQGTGDSEQSKTEKAEEMKQEEKKEETVAEEPKTEEKTEEKAEEIKQEEPKEEQKVEEEESKGKNEGSA